MSLSDSLRLRAPCRQGTPSTIPTRPRWRVCYVNGSSSRWRYWEGTRRSLICTRSVQFIDGRLYTELPCISSVIWGIMRYVRPVSSERKHYHLLQPRKTTPHLPAQSTAIEQPNAAQSSINPLFLFRNPPVREPSVNSQKDLHHHHRAQK